MFNLPQKSRTRETGVAIGSKLREVLDVNVSASGVQWVKCLRVRVRIDVTKRLVRGKRVNNTFLPFEAQVILGIPVSPRLLEDSLIWGWTPNGRFSVKSAYRVAQRCVQQSRCQAERGENSDGSRLKTLWKLI